MLAQYRQTRRWRLRVSGDILFQFAEIQTAIGIKRREERKLKPFKQHLSILERSWRHSVEGIRILGPRLMSLESFENLLLRQSSNIQRKYRRIQVALHLFVLIVFGLMCGSELNVAAFGHPALNRQPTMCISRCARRLQSCSVA